MCLAKFKFESENKKQKLFLKTLKMDVSDYNPMFFLFSNLDQRNFNHHNNRVAVCDAVPLSIGVSLITKTLVYINEAQN